MYTEENICTCPDWWFPVNKRETLRKLPHGAGGVLVHHKDCIKRKKDTEIMRDNNNA